MNLKASGSSQRLQLSALNVHSLQVKKAPSDTPEVQSKSSLIAKKRMSFAKTEKKQEKQEHIINTKAKATALIKELGSTEIEGNHKRHVEIFKELQKLKPPFLDPTSMPKLTSKTSGIKSSKVFKTGDLDGINRQISSKQSSINKKLFKMEKLQEQINTLESQFEKPMQTLRKRRQKLIFEAKQASTPDSVARVKFQQASRLRQDLIRLQGTNATSLTQLKQLRSKVAKLNTQISTLSSDVLTLKGERSSIKPQSGQELFRKRAIEPLVQQRKEALELTLESKQLQLEEVQLLESDSPSDINKAKIKELKQDISQIKTDLKDTLWESVKNMHIQGVSSSTKLSMLMALDARQKEMDSMMNGVAKGLDLPLIYTGDEAPDGPHIRVTICGSSELSSDIDVNITAVGCPPGTDTQFVTRFNTEYATKHGDESGNDLDVNLYVEGVFPDWLTETKSGRIPMSQEAQVLDNQFQDVVSLIKVRKFVQNSGEWDGFVKQTLEKATEGAERDYLQKNLTEANDFFEKAEHDIGLKIEELRDEFPLKNDKELALIANNRLFEEYSIAADDLKELYQETKPKDDKILAKSHFELCKAEYFANEAALGKGVLRRVVVNEQLIGGINGKRQDKNDKINEELKPLKDTYRTARGQMGQLEELLEEISILDGNPSAIETMNDLESQALAIELKLIDTFGLEDGSDITDFDVALENMDTKIKELESGIQPLMPTLDISPQEALQSFNENFGDILKEINHHSDDVNEAAFRSSKYLGRMVRDVEALLKGIGEMDESGDLTSAPSKFAAIKTLIDKFGAAEGFKGDPDKNLLLIRKDKLGSGITEKRRLAGEVLKANGLHYDSTNDYKSAIIDLSASLNASVQSYLR